ncbi:protein-(glutamine-N5) methyltransferase [Aedoeadaptatus nemausensis]|uniref:Release factor glutamine methyltransferase n=1 Tax=Aedoeadaptatus nemausensis TaxID=2582829 RepID=A0A6V6Y039_9FIRM|nr:peptide chain release factor N(5)-glutamine methyltransferase [Peptoniphilus nemausensis]CAC9924806.1 protein-(glutamine-N5) methyltransferase [Peptoniphilus nemausensis]
MELKEAFQLCMEALGPGEEIKAHDLLEELFNITRKDFILESKRELTTDETVLLKSVLIEVEGGKPLPYILNKAYFMGEAFYVDERVLIPRYDTEHSIDLIRSLNLKTPRILEIGTGSGCVAISLAKLFPDGEIISADISKDALDVASINKENHKVHNLKFIQSDLFDKIDDSFDLIYSNPPYISEKEMRELDKSVLDFEPHLALHGGKNGLDFYEAITKEARRYLKSDGYLVFEIGAYQGETVKKLLEDHRFKDIHIRRDFSGLDRVLYGRL